MTNPVDRLYRPGHVVISRREAIRRSALAVGLVVSPGWLGAVDRAQAAAQGEHLSRAELALTSAIADRILPRTTTPGAVDVGVPAFIDRLYGEFMTLEERRMFSAGLAAVESASTAAHGGLFATLVAGDQDALLRTIARGSQDQATSFFLQIRTATVLGYFTSEEVGRRVLHYDPVPGRYDPCVPIGEVGNINWTT